jgi:putative transposase
MHLRRPRRVDGFPYVGIYRYSLRFGTHARRRLFVAPSPVTAAHEQILRTAREDQFAILAHCYTPDHLHLVLEGTSGSSDLRRFVEVSKQRVDYVFRTQLGIRSTWQEGYYERVLRCDEATEIVVRYVLENPVRAGLVMRAEDYPYSGAMFWPEHS